MKGINIGVCNMLKMGDFWLVGEENDVICCYVFFDGFIYYWMWNCGDVIDVM